MRILKYALFILVVGALGTTAKEMIKNHKPSKKSIESSIVKITEKLNEQLPNTVMFDEREGITFTEVKYAEGTLRYHAVGLGHFEASDANKTKVENHVLNIYCSDKLSLIREADIKFEYDITSEVRSLSDRTEHTKISFTPEKCRNFDLRKDIKF